MRLSHLTVFDESAHAQAGNTVVRISTSIGKLDRRKAEIVFGLIVADGDDLVTEWGNVYLPRISKRINRVLRSSYPSVAFTSEHAHAMLYACAYETAVYGQGRSDWCGVLSKQRSKISSTSLFYS